MTVGLSLAIAFLGLELIGFLSGVSFFMSFISLICILIHLQVYLCNINFPTKSLAFVSYCSTCICYYSACPFLIWCLELWIVLVDIYFWQCSSGNVRNGCIHETATAALKDVLTERTLVHHLEKIILFHQYIWTINNKLVSHSFIGTHLWEFNITCGLGCPWNEIIILIYLTGKNEKMYIKFSIITRTSARLMPFIPSKVASCVAPTASRSNMAGRMEFSLNPYIFSYAKGSRKKKIIDS